MPGKRLTFADEHNDVLVVVRIQISFPLCIINTRYLFSFSNEVCICQAYRSLMFLFLIKTEYFCGQVILSTQ